MKYLIQGKNNLPFHDFGFELIQSLKTEKRELDYSIGTNSALIIDYMNCCPVGSVEFVHAYFQTHNIPVPKPINIPEELFHYAGTRPRIVGPNIGFKMDCYVKNTDTIKHPLNGVKSKTPETGTWLVTDYLGELLSEWRCFVFHDELLDCKIYQGDPWYPPSEAYIKELISKWKTAPKAYTLDVGVFNNHTILIECHNFYSCGMYGFSSHYQYPYMLSQCYSEWLMKSKADQNLERSR